MPISENWISHPLTLIDSFFERKMSISCDDVVKFFSEKLQSDLSRLQIPSLNDRPLHELPSGSLVRYRCMVQDMFDPEFFLGTCEVQNSTNTQRRLCTAMYRDIISCAPHESVDFDSSRNVTADRQTIYCVPVPGENAWVKEAYAGAAPPRVESASCSTVPVTNKRVLDVDNSVTVMASQLGNTPGNTTTTCTTSVAGDSSMETSDTNEATLASEAKRLKTSISQDVSVLPAAAELTDLNFPLPNEKGPACLVKLYGTSIELKLNDVVEVIGVLSTDPSLAIFHDPTQSMDDGHGGVIEPMDGLEVEQLAKNPPPSLVPRVHAIIVKKLDHSNPCLPTTMTIGCSLTDGTALQDAVSLREEILAVLEHALIGDRLAAEYLLCHLGSAVYSRQNVLALGKFALNLSGCPHDRGLNFIGQLSRVLSLLVTKSHLLPMSLENMNRLRFAPRKDYTMNRLRSGLLQLSANTHLVVDETALEPGQLDANGVTNMTALGDVITWQKLDYDFEFHRQTFPTDIPVLVMSEGKSILKCDCQLPLLFDPASLANLDETYRGIDTYLTPHLLDRIRAYLGQVRLLAYSLTDDVQKLIEEDFVATRRDDSNNMSVDDFHSLLTLARLLSLSCAEPNLTVATWQRAKSMESLRKQRLQVVV